jgi:hypothetical protein
MWGASTLLPGGDYRYDVILLDPKRQPQGKQEPARRFALWLVSPEGQAAIATYKVNDEQLCSTPRPQCRNWSAETSASGGLLSAICSLLGARDRGQMPRTHYTGRIAQPCRAI